MTRSSERDVVISLHGLARSNLSMLVPHLMLRRAGYEPRGIDYPSRQRSLQELAAYVRERLRDVGDRRVHVLTHSRGGLVARCLLRDFRPANLGRVVMLAPPNQGSRLAAGVRPRSLFKRLMGPAAEQMGDHVEHMEEVVGPVDFELGVITGDRPLLPVNPFLEPPHDGRVRVDEARIEGMADFLVVHRDHALIMNDPRVVRQAIHFFENGEFDRS